MNDEFFQSGRRGELGREGDRELCVTERVREREGEGEKERDGQRERG